MTPADTRAGRSAARRAAPACCIQWTGVDSTHPLVPRVPDSRLLQMIGSAVIAAPVTLRRAAPGSSPSGGPPEVQERSVPDAAHPRLASAHPLSLRAGRSGTLPLCNRTSPDPKRRRFENVGPRGPVRSTMVHQAPDHWPSQRKSMTVPSRFGT